jgi:hypothetical protein
MFSMQTKRRADPADPIRGSVPGIFDHLDKISGVWCEFGICPGVPFGCILAPVDEPASKQCLETACYKIVKKLLVVCVD